MAMYTSEALKIRIVLHPEILPLGTYPSVIIKDKNIFMNKKILWKDFTSVHFHYQAISVSSILVYPCPTISLNFITPLCEVHFIQLLFTFPKAWLKPRSFCKPYYCWKYIDKINVGNI